MAPTISGDESFTWSTGAATYSIGVNATGVYWITLDMGGCIASDTIHVMVNPKPIVNLGTDDSLCMGSPIILRSLDSYVSPAYLWNTGSTRPNISPAVSNKYWLAVTVDGCTGADTVNVIFKPSPKVDLGNDTAICPYASLILQAVEPEGTLYNWNTGSTASSIHVLTPGLYKLTVIENGCSASDSILISSLSNSFLDLGADTTLCNGEMIKLSSGIQNAIWSNQTRGTDITVTASGIYWASFNDVCGVVSDTIVVNYELCDLIFPTAFTPNDDQKDDIIRPLGNFKGISDYELSIYNRWGQCVFYTHDIYAGWDGKFNDVKQDLGTFFLYDDLQL